jgi:hypothetical protein
MEFNHGTDFATFYESKIIFSQPQLKELPIRTSMTFDFVYGR